MVIQHLEVIINYNSWATIKNISLNLLVTTTGGTGTSEPCVFPFKYKGTLYYECITVDKNTPWFVVK